MEQDSNCRLRLNNNNDNDHVVGGGHEEEENSILQLGGCDRGGSSVSTSNNFQVLHELPSTFFDEGGGGSSGGTVVIDSGIASSFFDNIESGQVIFKGILDHNGALVLDPAQFAALIGNVQLEQQQQHFVLGMTSNQREILPATTATTSLAQQQQQYFHSILPLTPLNQNQSNKLNKGLTSTSTSQGAGGVQEVFKSSTSSEPIMIQTLSTANNITRVTSRIRAVENTTVIAADSSIPKLVSIPEISDNRTSIAVEYSGRSDEDNMVGSRTEIENQVPEGVIELVEADPHSLGKGPYRCQECEKVFLKWPHFKRHRSEHLDSKAFRCPLCTMSFNFEINLQLHEMVHEAELSGCLECQMCPAKFSRLASLKSHIRVHEKEENLVCSECGDEFATKARLDCHIEEHKINKSLVHRCRLCGRTFTHAALLKDHSQEHSAVRNQLKLLNTRRKRPRQMALISSTDPPTVSETSELRSKSSRSKESKKKLFCSVCDKRFEKPSQLARHIRIHTGEKPYACNQCERSFNQKNTLDSHILSTHDKLKPHTCHLCNCQFSQRGNLRAHVLKVHIHPGNGEQCFKCEDCSCIFRKLASLNTHIAKVHSKTRPSCEPTSNNDASSVMFVGMAPMLPSVPSLISTAAEGNEPSQTFFNSTTGSAIVEPPIESITEVNVIHESCGQRTAYTVKVKRVGQEKFHLCPYNCNKSFKKPSDLIRHIRIHTQERPYVCTVCKRSFSVKSTLSMHMKTHSEQKDWECRECHKRFTVLNSLRVHERLHTGAKPFSCAQCGKWFRTSSQRRVHLKAHSRNSQGLTGKRRLLRIGDTEPKIDLHGPLKITSDGLVPVPNRSTLSILAQESNEDLKCCRPYRCLLCPSSFKKSSHLKQHQRSHTGERPYKCFQCFRSFISSGVLKNHIKTHEGVRAFKCKQCQLSFTTNGSLTRHMATHTEERSFVCPYCHKAFKTSVACRKHIKTHRSEFVALHTRGDLESDQLNSGTGQIDVTQPQNEDLGSHEDIYEDVNGNIYRQSGTSQATHVNQPEYLLGNVNDFVSTLPSKDAEHLSGNPQQEPEQIRDISHLVNPNNAHLRDDGGSQALHYSISSENMVMEEVVHHISLPDAQAFESSIFTLQGSDNIDLSSIIPTSSSSSHGQPYPHPTVFTSQPATFVRIEASSSDSANSGMDTDVPPEVSNIQTVVTTENIDDSDINKIRESSRPISEQIYNEMQTAASTEVEVNMAELLINNFSDLEKGKVNICTQCGRGFKKRSDLIRHARIHTGEKPFRCNVCGKAFRVKSTREAHMRTHEGGKTVACHVCNNLFSTKSSLRVHLRLHTGSRPYKCPHCDRYFRTSGHRKAHVSSHFKTSKEMKAQLANQQTPATHSTTLAPRKQVSTSVLPPVQTIKEKVEISQEFTDRNHHHVIYSADQGVQNASHQDPIQIIGSLQVSLDGSQLQNIQLSGLDLSTLQISEELLQSLGSVIFVAPHTNQIMTGDLSAVNLLGSGVSIRTEGGEGGNHHVMQDDVLNKQSSSVLTRKDVGDGSIAVNHQIQTSLPSIVSMSDLETLLPTTDDNFIGFTNFRSNNTINSSPMLSSTSTTVLGNKPTIKSNNHSNPSDQTQPISNKQCPTCGKIFAKPSLLNRHMTVHTGLKPYKCDTCSCTFNQKNSLEVHKYTHGTERPFICTACPFKTVGKAALKKHISRAHPDVNIDEILNASVKS